MLPLHLSKPVLNIAAVLVALSGPVIVAGRAATGVVLAVSLILVIIAAPHKSIWADIRPFLRHWLVFLIAGTALALSINIPFSIRVDLSFEAWLRSYALLVAIFYLVFCLQDQADLILKTLALSAGLILCAGVLSLFQLSKPDANSYMLILALSLYQCFKDKDAKWMGLGLLTVVLFIACTVITDSKASLAGFILMVSGAILIAGFRRIGVLKSLGLLGIFAIVSIAALSIWLPESMNYTTENSRDLAYLPVWLVDLHRQLIWSFSMDLAKESLWVGHGLNASNYHEMAQSTITGYFGPHFNDVKDLAIAPVLPGHPHNWAIEFLLDGGLIGLIPMLLCLGAVFYVCIRNYFITQHPALLSLIIVNIGYWATGLLNFSFWSVWWQAIYFLASALSFMLFVTRNRTAQ